MILDYEDTYMAWKRDLADSVQGRHFTNGRQVQDCMLHDTDESQLTERERLAMIFSVVIYEVENGLLTKEIKGEIGYYYDTMMSGELEHILAENEKGEVYADIRKYYKIVYGEE